MTTALLNNVDHGGWRVAVRHGADLGDAVNQMLLVPTEFVDAQREYPILLRRQPDGWTAVALLGLDRDENLFLDADRWSGRYVPAVQRRGPFLIGVENGDLKIRIDLDDPRTGMTEGQPIFLPHGGEAPYLVQVRDALAMLHAGVEAASSVYAAFDRAGLLVPVQLDITVDDDHGYLIEDCWTIDSARLAALEGPELARLHADGHLILAFAIVASLGNVQNIIERKRQALRA